MHRVLRAAAVICAVLATCCNLQSALGADANGIPVSTATGDQTLPVAVSDGAGGVIVAWHDERPGPFGACYAQRLNAAGVPQWTADGVALSLSNDAGPPVIVADGSGGAIVAYGGDTTPLRAQRVSAVGTPQWGIDGLQLTTLSGSRELAICADVGGSGGAIIAWRQPGGAGGTDDIYAQRVNSGGSVQWGTTGFGIATSNLVNERLPALATDNMGGAFFVWQNAPGIHIQRYNSAGSAVWTQEPLNTNANADPPGIEPDGTGGVVVSWSTGSGAFAQRITSTGTRLWSPSGSGVALASNGRATSIISNGAGGAMVTWQDNRSGTNYDIYAQNVGSSGTTLWGVDGSGVAVVTSDQFSPKLVTDGAGGSIITWYDARMSPSTKNDIYAQRMDGTGSPQWTLNGVGVCTAFNEQEFPTIASDGAGGAWIAWQDFRSTTNWDIYVSHMSGSGQVVSVGAPRRSLAEARVWPNPFADRVRMSFALPKAATVRTRVFDLHGRAVADLGTAALGEGAHEISWDGRVAGGSRAPEGLYFLRVDGPGIAVSRPVVELK